MDSEQRTCGWCGKSIEGHGNRKYCSVKCRERAKYTRKDQRGTLRQKAARYRLRYQNDEKFRRKVQLQARQRRGKVLQFSRDYKIARGCEICGYIGHPAALDFDHVRGNKSHIVSCSKTVAHAKEEIKKCRILCANCHRIVTYNRRALMDGGETAHKPIPKYGSTDEWSGPPHRDLGLIVAHLRKIATVPCE